MVVYKAGDRLWFVQLIEFAGSLITTSMKINLSPPPPLQVTDNAVFSPLLGSSWLGLFFLGIYEQ